MNTAAGSSAIEHQPGNMLGVGGLTPSPLTFRSFRSFQIRWREPLGKPGNPYLYRWTLIFFNFSVRLHHWIRSDDKRFFHDHACNFISIILRGRYTNVTPEGRYEVKAGSIWYAKADKRHYLDIPEGGAWTLLFCGRPYRKWGFWTGPNQKMRPWRYFHKFGDRFGE